MRREFVAEAVEPAAEQLMIDAVAVHPAPSIGKIGELGRDGTRWCAAREREPRPPVGLQQLHAGESCSVLGESFPDEARKEVCVDVYDGFVHSLSVAAAARSSADQMARGVIGSTSMDVLRAVSASLTALAIAAGAPR